MSDITKQTQRQLSIKTGVVKRSALPICSASLVPALTTIFVYTFLPSLTFPSRPIPTLYILAPMDFLSIGTFRLAKEVTSYQTESRDQQKVVDKYEALKEGEKEEEWEWQLKNAVSGAGTVERPGPWNCRSV